MRIRCLPCSLLGLSRLGRTQSLLDRKHGHAMFAAHSANLDTLTGALYVRISGGARRTDTLRLMLSSDAVSSVRTGVTFADRSTYSVQSVAGLVIGAILVVVTHYRDASYSRVTLGASGTDALRSVRDRDALCTTTAHDVAEQAGRDTVVVLAGLVVGTVVIRLALG